MTNAQEIAPQNADWMSHDVSSKRIWRAENEIHLITPAESRLARLDKQEWRGAWPSGSRRRCDEYPVACAPAAQSDCSALTRRGCRGHDLLAALRAGGIAPGNGVDPTACDRSAAGYELQSACLGLALRNGIICEQSGTIDEVTR